MQNTDALCVTLLDQILSLIRQSGSTYLEAAAALNSALQLLPALDLSLVRPDQKRRERHVPPRC